MRLIIFLTVWIIAAIPVRACTEQDPCMLEDGRSYHVKVPDNWDGVTPMPVMLHFHGWMRQGTLVVKHMRISGATRRRGVLLLAPNGNGRTWDFWSAGSPDTGFAERVLLDAAKTYPIDWSRVYISGYSYGSAMAWRFSCESNVQIRALLAVSGTFYDQSERCENIPQEVRHVHGTRDTVMDFPFGPDGDTTYPVKLWRDHKDCVLDPREITWSSERRHVYQRRVWENCVHPGRITLDVHRRGHFIPRGWIAHQLDELLEAGAETR